MTLAAAAARRVIRLLVRAQHAVRDIRAAAPLDPPARTLALTVGVQQQRHLIAGS